MTRDYISEHAKERFKQRYNIEMPSIEYLFKHGIKQVAYNRKGHIIKTPNKGIYRCTYKERVLEYVVVEQSLGSKVVCTFNSPPENIDDKCFSYNREEIK